VVAVTPIPVCSTGPTRYSLHLKWHNRCAVLDSDDTSGTSKGRMSADICAIGVLLMRGTTNDVRTQNECR
jgi:hypothetical protein